MDSDSPFLAPDHPPTTPQTHLDYKRAVLVRGLGVSPKGGPVQVIRDFSEDSRTRCIHSIYTCIQGSIMEYLLIAPWGLCGV